MSEPPLREEYEMSAPSTSAGVADADGNSRPASKDSREALSNDKEEDKDKDKEEKPQEKPAGLGPYFVSDLQPRDRTLLKSPAIAGERCKAGREKKKRKKKKNKNSQLTR